MRIALANTNTHLQQAQELRKSMEIEEMAVKNARSLYGTIDGETRLDLLRQEAEGLLKEWHECRSRITEERLKREKEQTAMLHILPTWSPCVVSPVRIETAYRDGFKHKNEYISYTEVVERKAIAKQLQQVILKLREAEEALLEAIEYLTEYLHPSHEKDVLQTVDELPFTSLSGTIALESKAKTPQDLAKEVLDILIEKEGQNMRAEFLSIVKAEMPDEWYFTEYLNSIYVWELIDNAIFRLENGGVVLDRCGEEELYRQWREYPLLSNEFNVIVKQIRDYFINV